MNADTVKAIQEALTPLASKMGMMGAEYYRLAVQHSVFVGWWLVIAWTLASVLLVVVGVVLVRWAYKDEGMGSALLMAALVAAFLIMSLGWGVFAGVERITNPQYTAIQDIISTATQ